MNYSKVMSIAGFVLHYVSTFMKIGEENFERSTIFGDSAGARVALVIQIKCFNLNNAVRYAGIIQFRVNLKYYGHLA